MEHTTNIKAFMELLEAKAKRESIIIYFHNLGYDGVYILDYIIRNKLYKFTDARKLANKEYTTLITKQGVYYQIKIKVGKHLITIYDSYKLLSLPLEQIGGMFNIKKLVDKIDYTKTREEDTQATSEELDYLYNDLLIVKTFVQELFIKKGLKRMTASSNAYKSLQISIENKQGKNFTNIFPKIEEIDYKRLKNAYRGGLCQVFDDTYRGCGCSFDYNSLYPSVLLSRRYPRGKPMYKEGIFTCIKSKYNFSNISNLSNEELLKGPLYTQSALINFKLKENGVPCIFNNGKFNGFMINSHFLGGAKEINATMLDWQHILKNYDVEFITYLYNYSFLSTGDVDKEETSIFYEFINEHRIGKINADLQGNKVKRLLHKLMQNMCYGKFGSDIDGTQKQPLLQDNVIKYVEVENEKTTEYIPVALFCTSYARNELLNTIYKVGIENVLYCDTDSIHTKISEEEFKKRVSNIHNTNYHAWKHEYNFKKSKYLAPKTYCEVTTDDNLIVKCAGMSSKLKKFITYDNFNTNTTFEKANLKATNVPGGRLLQEVDFTIKNKKIKLKY